MDSFMNQTWVPNVVFAFVQKGSQDLVAWDWRFGLHHEFQMTSACYFELEEATLVGFCLLLFAFGLRIELFLLGFARSENCNNYLYDFFKSNTRFHYNYDEW